MGTDKASKVLVRLSQWPGLAWASGGALALGVVAYLPLAGTAPGLALIVSSVSVFAGALGLVLSVWPVEAKITFERQMEVNGARLGAAILAYFAVGFVVLWGLNQISAGTARVPIAWDGPFLKPWENSFFRRVTFWPFYALVLLGCQGIAPTPPGAC